MSRRPPDKRMNAIQARDRLLALFDDDNSDSGDNSSDLEEAIFNADFDSDSQESQVEVEVAAPPDGQALSADDAEPSGDDINDAEWILLTGNRRHKPLLIDFGEDTGPVWTPENATPMDYVERFFAPSQALDGDTLWQHLVFETDSYHDYLVEKADADKFLLGCYPADDMDVRMMKAFIGLWLNMGLNRRHNLNSCWDTSNRSQFTPVYGDTFRRNTFKSILQSFHASERVYEAARGRPGFNPCYKFQKVLDHFNEKWQAEWHLNKNISIDESIVGHKGKHELKVYIRIKKHHQWGAKEYNLADSETHYLYRTLYHTNQKKKPKFGQPYEVCEKLCAESDVFGKNHHLFTDNYYGSMDLVQNFLEKDTYVTTTVQANRKGLCPELKAATGIPDDLMEARKGPIYCCRWNDRANVRFLSTHSESGRTHIVDHYGKDREIPNAALEYNKWMGGVDSADQMTDCYSNESRTVKLWKRVVFHLIDRTVTNAYILYLSNPNEARPKMSHYQFRVKLIEGLIHEYQEPRKRPGRPSAAPPNNRLVDRHFLEEMAEDKRRDCSLCSNRLAGKRKRISTWCKDCKTVLCIPCFKIWHTKKDPVQALRILRRNEEDA